jgi:hypothetical protein
MKGRLGALIHVIFIAAQRRPSRCRAEAACDATEFEGRFRFSLGRIFFGERVSHFVGKCAGSLA